MYKLLYYIDIKYNALNIYEYMLLKYWNGISSNITDRLFWWDYVYLYLKALILGNKTCFSLLLNRVLDVESLRANSARRSESDASLFRPSGINLR